MKNNALIAIGVTLGVFFLCCNNQKSSEPITLLYQDESKVIPFIKEYVDQIGPDHPIEIQGIKIFSLKVLPEFYNERNYEPAWEDTVNLITALDIIEGAANEGLDPDDYHFEALKLIWDQVKDVKDTVGLDFRWVAKFDILFTDAMMLYMFHLLDGKVDPETLDVDWNYGFAKTPGDEAEMFDKALNENTLADLVASFRPQSEGYPVLLDELKLLMDLEEHGGWDSIIFTGKVEPGDTSKTIPYIRHRLQMTNDLSDTSDLNGMVYDPDLVSDVKIYQRRHGILDDGIIGQGTIDVLNIPVVEKIDKIRANLERHRWVVRDLTEDFLIVNIAGFELWVYKDAGKIHKTKVMVGKPYHKTPVFKSRMQYIEFNPTWTIPRSITVNETLHKLKKDANYLSRDNMVLLDNSGNVVPASGIDFSQYSGSNFPYVIRQQPGPGNALGEVKFIFPNQYSVYLHDTQSKSLFDKPSKAFSHGCIRVQYPLELATVILEGTDWTREKIDKTIKSEKTIRANLEEPLDVLLLYWTVGNDDDGYVTFLPDIYDRDQAIIDQLNEEFVYGPELYEKYRTDGVEE